MTTMAVDHREALTWLARGGYAARGVVYVIIGWFAVVAALGAGGRTTDGEGALQSILGQPFGHVLLGIIALGLLGYALWRIVQSLTDTDDHGTDAKGLAIRAGLVISAVAHVLLAVFAVSLIVGTSGGGGTQDWTAWLMTQPFGRWLVALVGVAVIGAGIAHIWKGWHVKFEKHLMWDADTRRVGTPVCRFGLIARGVVFLIIGGFFLVAALRASAGEARGLAGALDALRDQPYGWILLGITALGLIAFGVYSLIEAAYRRINLKH